MDLFGEEIKKIDDLKTRFMEIPFSVIDTRGGNWLLRKKRWLRLGIKSHLGRENLNKKTSANDFNRLMTDKYKGFTSFKNKKNIEGMASIFNPALCELMYHWFCPENGSILDPFAGGSVRGIVANYLGYKYTGIEIRKEQVDSNIEQSLNILPILNQPIWIVGDSNEILDDINIKFDMLFTCPPYLNLEIYSDLEGDISNKNTEAFMELYENIIKKSLDKLNEYAFACIVVGDVRINKNFYFDLPSKTKLIFYKYGYGLYNEMIYVTPIGSKCMTANNLMKSKKIGKHHEYVLIFKKQ